MSTKTLKLRKTQKFTFLKIQKSTKHRVHTKQRNGGTRNKHCNLLIYTVPLNRVLIERCYYNIQTIQYHNNADLIFLQCIFRRCQRRLLILEKTQKFTFLKIQKTQKHRVHTKQRNGGTKNKHCNLLIYTVPLNRVLIERCYYNIQTIKYHNNAELIFLQHISRRCQPRL